MKKFSRYLISSLVVVMFLMFINGCAQKSVNINGVNYPVFNEQSTLNAQYIKGYISDYKGLVSGRAYNVPSANYVWLSKNIKFSQYKNLTILDFENLSGSKTLRYQNDRDIDIAQTVTNSFLQSTELRKMFKKISKANDEEKVSNGLIIKGAVTHASIGLKATIYAEIMILDGKTKNVVGKIILSSSHAHYQWASNKVASITAEVIEKYLDASPGFDGRDLIKE